MRRPLVIYEIWFSFLSVHTDTLSQNSCKKNSQESPCAPIALFLYCTSRAARPWIFKVDFLVFSFFMYVIQHCFICHPSDSTVSEDLGSNPGLLRLWHRQPDALTTWLDLIPTWLDLIRDCCITRKGWRRSWRRGRIHNISQMSQELKEIKEIV
jgi:hypothetical protein